MALKKIILVSGLLAGFSGIVLSQQDTLFNQTDAQHHKQGWWKKTFPNGKPIYEGFFKDDKPVGRMKRYYESGVIKAILDYNSSGNHAHVNLYYQNGKLAADGCYTNKQPDSTWNYYSFYSHTLTSKETYVNGKKNGPTLHYYSNGNISEKMMWVNNKKEGPWEQYFENEVPKLKATYHDDQLEGNFVVNYENGKPYLTGYYHNDLRVGKWVFHKEDGSVERALNYTNGTAPGEDSLSDRQQEIFRMIEENKGKYQEPDETNFLTPQGN